MRCAMYRTLAAVVGIGSLIAMLATASATTITIDSNQDATIYENTVNNSNGAGPGMYAGTNAMLSPRRALLGFDIAGNVPTGATIESVQLTLFLGQVAGGRSSNVTIGLHTLMNDWGEGTTGSGSPTIEDIGHGFPANPGDTTWNARFFPATLWETPGGDFDASASATATVGSVINNRYT